MLLATGSAEKAIITHKAACSEFDQAQWSSRLKDLSAAFDQLRRRGQLLLDGDKVGADVLLQDIRKNLAKYGIPL
jgi:hypothetical protein